MKEVSHEMLSFWVENIPASEIQFITKRFDGHILTNSHKEESLQKRKLLF